MEQNNGSEEATPGPPTPGELHSGSTNTPPMDICVWSSSSATGRGNNTASPFAVIEEGVIRFEKAAK